MAASENFGKVVVPGLLDTMNRHIADRLMDCLTSDELTERKKKPTLRDEALEDYSSKYWRTSMNGEI